MKIEFLKAHWDTLITGCGVDARVAFCYYEDLVNAYSERHRVYHNLTHIAQCLTELDTAPHKDAVIEWATWYHDAIYYPGAPDNESRSALLARNVLMELGLDQELGPRVAKLILSTQSHKADEGDMVQKLFLDADLAILGANVDDYATYARAVRDEYCNIPDILYRRGRREFLESMLHRNHIFLSDHFRDRYEQQANTNLTMELASYS